MPVTFCPAPSNKVESYGGYCGGRRYFPSTKGVPAATSSSLLERTYKDPEKKQPIVKHLQSSFGREGAQTVPVVPQNNGFIDTVVDAYSSHQALVIRPDDVWIGILTQFSFYVNGDGQAERLRYLFVAHEDKEELVVEIPDSHPVDFGALARMMTEKIHENVVDPELRDWTLPDFSTTTANDTVVASVVMMATLKAYFEYTFMGIDCGLPRVTLLGTQDDWISIFRRVDKLGRYGPETAAWRDLLRPVLARFVQAFEPGYAESAENLDFWQRVADRDSGGSGPTYLSGWITAFCAFDREGKWLGSRLPLAGTGDEGSLHDQDRFIYDFGTVEADGNSRKGLRALRIDGVAYHKVDCADIPAAAAEVDVKLKVPGAEVDCVMVAGVIGTSLADVVANDDGSAVQNGQVSPASAWWMFMV